MRQSHYLPTIGGGKYHLLVPIAGTAACRGLELDTSATPIIVNKGDKPHPVVCKRCLAIAQKA